MVVRVLLGALFVFSGLGGLLGGPDAASIPEAMRPALHVLWETGIFQMIKVTEIVAGLMLVVGFLPALALLFLSPICVGILVFNSRVAPEGLPLGIIVTLVTAYLGYAYFDTYKAIFVRAK